MTDIPHPTLKILILLPLAPIIHPTPSNSLSQLSFQFLDILPFRVVWRTHRSCSLQVILKAVCALIPKDDWSSITVKGSSRQRGTRYMCGLLSLYLLRCIDSVWHILEARLSWSLQPSLSSSQISNSMHSGSLLETTGA